MEYMYHYGISAHFYGVFGILTVILINMFVTQKAQNIAKLRRFMVIFTPMGSVMLGGVIFTGVIMMAAKHLEFTWQNNLMIAVSIVLIILEAKRAKKLRYIKQEQLPAYKNFAFMLLSIQSTLVIVMATIMRF